MFSVQVSALSFVIEAQYKDIPAILAKVRRAVLDLTYLGPSSKAV